MPVRKKSFASMSLESAHAKNAGSGFRVTLGFVGKPNEEVTADMLPKGAVKKVDGTKRKVDEVVFGNLTIKSATIHTALIPAADKSDKKKPGKKPAKQVIPVEKFVVDVTALLSPSEFKEAASKIAVAMNEQSGTIQMITNEPEQTAMPLDEKKPATADAKATTTKRSPAKK
jgi:hypothetical protein